MKFVYKIPKKKLGKQLENYEVLITNPGSTYKYDKGLLKKLEN